MKRALLAVAIASSLAGCASINVSTPADREIERSRTFSVGFEPTWTSAVDWFADHNISIEKIEKTSGLLTAKYALAVDQKYLDCGDIKHSGLLGEPTVSRVGTLNVTIRETKPAHSRVNVNFFGEYKFAGRDSWDGRPVLREGTCKTTGLLEKNILNYIAAQNR